MILFRYSYWLVFFVAIALAAFLRLYHLGEAPPGLNVDEAVYGEGALDILEKGPRFFINFQGGGGIITAYIVSFFFWLLEPSALVLRFQAGFMGVLTTGLVFFTVRAMLADPTDQGKTQANWIAALSALFLAIDPRYATIGRTAFSAMHVPFLQVLTILCFWQAYNISTITFKKKIYTLFSAVFLALNLYAYLSAFITPPLFLTFMMISLLSDRIWPIQHRIKTEEGQQPFQWAYFWGAFCLMLFPLLLFYVFNPQSGSIERVNYLTGLIFNEETSQGGPWGRLWYGLVGNYTAFGLSPLQALLNGDWLALSRDSLNLLVCLGLGLLLFYLRQPAYQFLLLWWSFTILPAALSPDSIPHILRAIGVYTPTSIIAAFCVVTLSRQVGRGLRLLKLDNFTIKKQYFLGLAALSLLILGQVSLVYPQKLWSRFTYYFNHWPHKAHTQTSYNLPAVELANYMMAQSKPQTAYFAPFNATTQFLYRLSDSPSPLYWISPDEAILAQNFAQVLKQNKTVQLVRWTDPLYTKYVNIDPKHVLDYYLQKYGTLTAVQAFPLYQIEHYRLDFQPENFQTTEVLNEINLNFAHQIELLGYAFGNTGVTNPLTQTVEAGQQIWAKLRWQALHPHPEDMKVSLRLQDQQGHRVAQVDQYLLNNILRLRSRDWPFNQAEDLYLTLPIPEHLMPGLYTLGLRVYGDKNLQPLPAIHDPNPTHFLGKITLKPPAQIADRTVLDLPSDPFQRIEHQLALYLSPDLIPQEAKPGQTFNLALTWQALEAGLPAYQFDLTLDQTDILQPKTLIGGEAYPITAWRKDEVLSQQLRLRMPPNIQGPQTLTLQIWLDETAVAPWAIKSIEIRDWPHQHALPETVKTLTSSPPVFAAQIVWLGYQVIPSGPDNRATNLILYWRGLEPLQTNYLSFVHVLNEADQLLTQVDHEPGNGAYPSSGWVPGEVIVDEFRLAIDLCAAVLASNSFDDSQRPKNIMAGFYHPQTFHRLPLKSDSADIRPEEGIIAASGNALRFAIEDLMDQTACAN